MKKTTTILFLGLALISFKSFAEDTGVFSEFSGNFQQEISHELRGEDNKFLSEVEEMQKNIRLMQLELKEKELQYKVEEQERKLDTLSISTDCSSNGESINTSILGTLVTPPMLLEGPAPIYVSSIKGIKNKLKATVYSDDLGISIVSVGDTLNNGFKVKNISNNTVTFEKASGDIDVVGIRNKI